MRSVKIQLDKKSAVRLQKGYPMLEKQMLGSQAERIEEGTLLELMSGENFIATGYYGRQNKGYGWVLEHDRSAPIDGTFFKKKFEHAFKKRDNYRKDPYTTSYRVFNGEGDGVGGLTIDYLDGHYLLTWYSKGIYFFKDAILQALVEMVDYKSIYEKKRFDTKGQYIDDDDFVMGERPQFPITVLENGVKFPVYLNDGPMIGFFLDQKDVRRRIRDHYSKGKEVLNTFSYTGAFSVYAALGGAKVTTSVDLAKRSRPRTREIFEINGIDPNKQSIIVEDVFNYFKYAVRKKLSFDMVILDPPSFARSKKRTFSVAKDYSGLLEDAIRITRGNGVIVASTNYSGGDMKWFRKQVDIAFNRTGCRHEILETYQLPDDFVWNDHLQGSNYLKVLFIRKCN